MNFNRFIKKGFKNMQYVYFSYAAVLPYNCSYVLKTGNSE